MLQCQWCYLIFCKFLLFLKNLKRKGETTKKDCRKRGTHQHKYRHPDFPISVILQTRQVSTGHAWHVLCHSDNFLINFSYYKSHTLGTLINSIYSHIYLYTIPESGAMDYPTISTFLIHLWLLMKWVFQGMAIKLVNKNVNSSCSQLLLYSVQPCYS
jgi:hypothetical protein